ncbi:hypothetical protein FRB95_000391 [Tulasnella sp. JGI-2019a]|nr:hypothetical protein FRB95_000391 [Tulasnella sp. JGI-2019a]
MPPELQYACVHIATNISHTPRSSADVECQVKTFAETSLMVWLEALSVMKRTHDTVGMATLIASWFKLKQRRNLVSFFKSPPSAHLTDVFRSFIMPPSATGTLTHSTATTSDGLFLFIIAALYRFLAGIISLMTATALSSTDTRSPESYDLTLALLRDFQCFIMES